MSTTPPMTNAQSPFLFGHCTNSTFGSVALDMITLPVVLQGMQASGSVVGGGTTSITGRQTIDRIGMKRSWSLSLGAYLPESQWWPVVRMWENYSGPWLFFDQSRPNLLSGVQAAQLAGWTNGTTALTVRPDGATSVASGGAIQMGAASPTVGTLAPVVAGQQYFAAVTAYGPGAWTVNVSVAWFTAAGVFISWPAGSNYTAANALSTNTYLDGTLTSQRVGGPVTAPAAAAYVQLKVSVTGAAVDISDPSLVPGPMDVGNSMYVVNVVSLGETHQTLALGSTLDLKLAEV